MFHSEVHGIVGNDNEDNTIGRELELYQEELTCWDAIDHCHYIA